MTGTNPLQSGISPGRRRFGGALAWCLLAFLVAGYAGLAPLTADHDDKDWTHLWLGGRMVVTGHAAELYEPQVQLEVFRQADPHGQPPQVWAERNDVLGSFNYPPPAALAYAALAWLDVRTAAVVHAYLNVIVAVLVAIVFCRKLGRPEYGAAMAVAVLAYPAFFVNLSIGQNAVWSLAVVLVGWSLVWGRWDLAGGMVLGLLCLKPNWLFAVGWVPLVLGRWRMLGGVGLGAGAVTATTALCIGVGPFVDYVNVFRQVADLHEMPGYYLAVKYNALAMFRKWMGSGASADIAGWISCLILVVATWRVTRRRGETDQERLWAMACCVMSCLWVNPHLNYYDLLMLAPCTALIFWDWSELGRSGRRVALAVGLFVYVAMPVDHSWSLGSVLPLPSLSILAIWGWFAWRLVNAQRTVSQGRLPRTVYLAVESAVPEPVGAGVGP